MPAKGGEARLRETGRGEDEPQRETIRLLKKILLAVCSKTLRYKAPEIPACGRQAEE